MTIRYTLTSIATGIALLTSPAFAGGPVLTTEEPHVAEARPSSEGRWVIPVVIGLAVICAIACGGDDDGPVIEPPKPCNGGC